MVLLLLLLSTSAAHHLLYLGLLAGQALDVSLQVVEGVVHGVQVASVRVHVHVLHVRGPHRVGSAGGPCSACNAGGAVSAQPAGLHGREVLVQILRRRKWETSARCT